MSEYQYYEFATVEGELTEGQMADLRGLSSRAEITPTSFVNEYNFGNFRGDPQQLVEKYFDAFVYYANWGSRQFMLRMPADLLSLATVKPYCVAQSLTARSVGKFVIVDFQASDDLADWQSDDWMEALLPVRDDLMQGDLRPLYLAWLSGVLSGAVNEDEREPPIPAGMKKLPERLHKLADFLYVDRELLKVAASVSDAAQVVAEPSQTELKNWISKLAVTRKNEFLLRVAEGETSNVQRELKQQFLKSWRAAAERNPPVECSKK
jgi:hypothetical protein